MKKISLSQLGKQMWDEQEAVTSLEYALLGTLIALGIIVGVGLVGTNTLALWSLVSNCVVSATTGAGSC